MAEHSYEFTCAVPDSLIKSLKDDKQIKGAEKVVKDSGLGWIGPKPLTDNVIISGPSDDLLKFAIECLETMLDKHRNPSCFLIEGKVQFHFFDTLGDKIFKSREELKKEIFPLGIDKIDKIPGKYVELKCSFEQYSKLKKAVDKIRDSKPSSTSSSGSVDKSLVGNTSQPNPTSNKQSSFHYSFNAKKIKVCVYKASIIDVTGIDAIVNAANEDLDHYGGIAFKIRMAAGSSVNDDCLDYVSRNGRVKVGCCCVTRAGNLKHLKGIIHAVGPCWKVYTSDKEKCALDLHETVVHVLQKAHEHNFTKIALPAISSGMLGGVPLNICADMYVKAVMDYSRDANPNCITEVHFVDINEEVLKEIKKSHEKWLRSPDSLGVKKVLNHAGGKGGVKPRQVAKSVIDVAGHHGSASYLPCEVQYCGTETMKSGGQQTIFKVEKNVTLRIYSGSIVKVSEVDALICSVGSNFKGGKLAEAFESAGGAVYTKALLNLKKRSHSVGDVLVLLEPGNMRSKCVLLAMMESKRIMTVDENTAQKLKDLYVKILETASTYGLKRIALTLLGSGMLVNDSTKLECCCKCLIDGLTNSHVVRGICVEDIQVVNIHPEVTDAIVRAFHQRSTQSQAKSKFEGVVGEYKSSNERMPKPKKHALQIQHTQSLKMPNGYKKGGGKKEKEKCASVHVPSSRWFSQDKDDSYYQAHGNELQRNDRNEVKQKERAQYSSSSLSSQDEEDADNFEQSRNEKYHLKQTQGKQPVAGDGVSWMGTGNGGKLGNIPMYDVKEDMLKTLNKCKIENSVDTCSSDTCDKTAKEALDCGHKFCEICLIPMQRNHVCTICSQKSSEITLGASSTNPGKITEMPDVSSSSDTCIICMEKLDTRQKLPCGHDSFHKKCIEEAFVYKEVCPLCGKVLGRVTGSQPKGNMKITYSKRSLSGYEGCGLIEIVYEFQDGTQSGEHPHPGKPYKGTRRKAYLPDNREGQIVLKMMEVAFHRKLVFTIGESRTTGKTDTVTWNDIHHKTRIDGGPSNYGYPDPDYLRRVREELEAKGITEADI